MEFLLIPASEEREENIEYHVKMFKVLWGTLPFDEEDMRKVWTLQYDRAFYPQGMRRQLVGMIAHGNRKPRLSSVTAPTLVIHGAEDPLIPVENGKDTAEAIPGAELLIMEGMGHCLPRAAWPQLIDAIAKHTSQVPV
jgi:pimeloyl-ACP methyl ester carboxylesterase